MNVVKIPGMSLPWVKECTQLSPQHLSRNKKALVESVSSYRFGTYELRHIK